MKETIRAEELEKDEAIRNQGIIKASECISKMEMGSLMRYVFIRCAR